MNFRRGFFRLWLVTSTLFAVLVSVIFFDDIQKEFARSKLDFSDAGILLVPVLCNEARGVDGKDYDSRGPWNEYRTAKLCWYQEPTFRTHYPEYKDLDSKSLTHRLYKAAELTLPSPPAPWRLVGIATSIALAVPLIVLILGSLIGWVFKGFGPQARASS